MSPYAVNGSNATNSARTIIPNFLTLWLLGTYIYVRREHSSNESWLQEESLIGLNQNAGRILLLCGEITTYEASGGKQLSAYMEYRKAMHEKEW